MCFPLRVTQSLVIISLCCSSIPLSVLNAQERVVISQATIAAGSLSQNAESIGPGFPFEMTGTNHFYVEVKLNGEGPYRLIFDLGAPVTLLSVKAARESRSLTRDKVRSAMGAEGLVKEMQFGESVAKEIPVVVFDHPAITTMSKVLGKRFDGILGYTFFARYRTTIDYQKKRLWFEPVREKTDNLFSALPEKMLNPGKKTAARVVVPRSTAIGIRIETNSGINKDKLPPISRIVEVRADSPAAKSGLKVGDQLISLGSYWIFTSADLAEALSAVEPGATVKAIVSRDGQTIEVTISPEKVF